MGRLCLARRSIFAWTIPRRTLPALLGLAFIQCAKPPDPIAHDVAAITDRTVPHGGRLVLAYPLRREGDLARASWQIEAETSWEAYAEQVIERLPEFRVAERRQGRLRLLRALAGDQYHLEVAGEERGRTLVIQLAFEAQPF